MSRSDLERDIIGLVARLRILGADCFRTLGHDYLSEHPSTDPDLNRIGDRFPDLMATALSRRDIAQWAADEDIALVRTQADRCRDILRSMGRAGKDDLHMRQALLGAVIGAPVLTARTNASSSSAGAT